MAETGRGFPISCGCGARVSRRTSRTKTKTNLGRLFYSCPYGDEHNPNHLFKWTDESMVEEIEDMKVRFDAFVSTTQQNLLSSQSSIDHLASSSRASTCLLNNTAKEVNVLEKDIHHLKIALESLKIELKSLKNMVICVLLLVLLYKLLV
ncbi:hypothetical protein Bca4012_011375 [Brassica carinata]